MTLADQDLKIVIMTGLMRVLTCCLVAVALGDDLLAQSLGELARQEEARRNAVRSSGKVYTNDSLRGEAPPRSAGSGTTTPAAAGAPATTAPSPSGVPRASTPGAAPAASGQDATAKPAIAEPAKDQAYWKQRMDSAREALSRAQTFADALQSRINALTADFAARDDPAQRSTIGTDRQKALTELERVKQEIQQHTKTIATIQDEARRANVPPGWLR